MNVPKLRFKADDGSEFPEWEEKRLSDVGTVAMCKRVFKEQTSENGEVPFFKIGTFGDKPDAYISYKLFDELRTKYPYPKKGTVLLSASGTVGRQVIYNGEDAYYQDSNIVWLEHDDTIMDGFLKQFYSIVKWKGLEGSTIKRLYNKTILDTIFYLPSLPEQSKIADFLSTIDEIIQSTESELTAWQERKKGVMQKIFSREVRFKADDGSEFPEWEEKRLGEVTSRVTRRNNNMISDIPLTISGVYGLIDQRKYFNKIVAASDLSNYYLLKNGEFAYNRSSSVGYDFGAIKRLDSCEYGAVSTLYVCFSILDENDVCSDYLRVYFDSNIWNKYAASVCAEGARNHGLLNISVNDFFDMPVYIPSLPEQKRIAECLSALDEVITLTKKELSAWKEFKKGLLQQMFV